MSFVKFKYFDCKLSSCIPSPESRHKTLIRFSFPIHLMFDLVTGIPKSNSRPVCPNHLGESAFLASFPDSADAHQVRKSLTWWAELVFSSHAPGLVPVKYFFFLAN